MKLNKSRAPTAGEEKNGIAESDLERAMSNDEVEEEEEEEEITDIDE